jgi:hypothetical protein
MERLKLDAQRQPRRKEDEEDKMEIDQDLVVPKKDRSGQRSAESRTQSTRILQSSESDSTAGSRVEQGSADRPNLSSYVPPQKRVALSPPSSTSTPHLLPGRPNSPTPSITSRTSTSATNRSWAFSRLSHSSRTPRTTNPSISDLSASSRQSHQSRATSLADRILPLSHLRIGSPSSIKDAGPGKRSFMIPSLSRLAPLLNGLGDGIKDIDLRRLTVRQGERITGVEWVGSYKWVEGEGEEATIAVPGEWQSTFLDFGSSTSPSGPLVTASSSCRT